MDKLTMYHGTNHVISKFNYDWVGKGTDQEGVGIYLTSSIEDAKRYGKNVYVVDAYYRKFVRTTGKKNASDAKFLINRAPDLEETLTNWDMNPQVAKVKALRAMIEYTKNPHDMYMQIWYDFYRDNPAEYLKNMVRLGYDGVLLKKNYGILHFVAFDPDKLRIVK